MTPWLAALKFTAKGEYHIPNRPLAGRAVTIIGGGPSVRGCLVEAVQDLPVICANNSFLLMDRPALVVALDRRWYKWHGQPLKAGGHIVVTALRGGTHLPYTGAYYAMKKSREATYPPDHETLAGTNSGHAAVSLAIILGAKSIFLIGFDMGFVDGKSHYHGGHPIPASEGGYANRFRPKFEQLATTAAAKGINLASITPTVADIPRISLQSALKELRLANRLDHPKASTPL